MNIPEKWCIKNCQEVGKWFDDQRLLACYEKNCLTDYLHCFNYPGAHITDMEHPQHVYSSYAQGQIRLNFTEITIEQFREYISKTTATPIQQDYKYLTKLLKTLKIK